MNKSFTIVDKKKTKIINSQDYFIIALILSVGLIFINHKLLQFKEIENILFYVFILSFTAYIGRIIFSFSETESINGNKSGKLKFFKDKIIIKDREFLLKSIKKIDFHVFEYEGEFNTIQMDSVEPKYKNGSNNFMELNLNNGENLKIYFIQTYQDEFLKISDELIEYHKNGLFSFLKLIQFLKIEDYDKIQEFKKTKLI